MISYECTYPRNDTLEKDDRECPTCSKFASNGCNRCNTWCVEQAEHENRKCSCRTKDAAHRHIGIENLKRRDNTLLGKESRHKSCCDTPVAKS